MKRRLYFLFPTAGDARRLVRELAAAGVDEGHIHALARTDIDLSGLPPATRRQQHDTVWRLEQTLWGSNLAVFGAALVGLLVALVLVSRPGRCWRSRSWRRWPARHSPCACPTPTSTSAARRRAMAGAVDGGRAAPEGRGDRSWSIGAIRGDRRRCRLDARCLRVIAPVPIRRMDRAQQLRASGFVRPAVPTARAPG